MRERTQVQLENISYKNITTNRAPKRAAAGPIVRAALPVKGAVEPLGDATGLDEGRTVPDSAIPDEPEPAGGVVGNGAVAVERTV